MTNSEQSAAVERFIPKARELVQFGGYNGHDQVT